MTPLKFAKKLTELSDYNILPSQVKLWNCHYAGDNHLTEKLAIEIANQWREKDPDEVGDPYGLLEIQSLHLESIFEESIVRREPVPWSR